MRWSKINTVKSKGISKVRVAGPASVRVVLILSTKCSIIGALNLPVVA